MAEIGCGKGFIYLLRNLVLAVAIYGSLYTLVSIYQTRSISIPTQSLKSPTKDAASKVPAADKSIPTPPSLLHTGMDNINLHANWFNRPESLVVPKDNYLGTRPSVDTIANLTKIVSECRGSYEKFERMPYVADCLQYLASAEHEYYSLPSPPERESAQSPKQAEYLNADGASNTLTVYPSYTPASPDSIGACNGPIVPYHTYWTGAATWRVEIFVKSYLYTQNLPCSRLWIWLDADRNPHAVDDMLHRDALFARFLPLVERGDIVLKEWKFPSRIALPSGDNTDGRGYYVTPGKPNAAGEVAVAEGLVRDAAGTEWLVLTDKQKTFLPVAISDAVRFVVLHQFGGSYYDMDTVLLRDMRPLLIGRDEHNFAERWAAHSSPGDYNTAIMSLTANSTLSSYMLRGGVRMGMNFHPRVLGRMALKDGRNGEFAMLETAAFDPIWTEFNGARKGGCTIPCFTDYGMMFKGTKGGVEAEWSGLESESRDQDDLKRAGLAGRAVPMLKIEALPAALDVQVLAAAEYRFEEDHFPPTNRSLEFFFRGAWTYHIHNQWMKNPEPSSWFHTIQLAHDGFFARKRTNPYGEKWDGPDLRAFEINWEFV